METETTFNNFFERGKKKKRKRWKLNKFKLKTKVDMKKKVEYSTIAPPDAKPVLAVSSLSFHDTHGNEVKHGSIITIERNYNYHHLNGQKAVVKWDNRVGLFQYFLCEKLKTYQQAGGDDFYGISSFKVCGCASCMDLNGQNIGNMYVCPDCGRVVD